jgi:hypothetical protein
LNGPRSGGTLFQRADFWQLGQLLCKEYVMNKYALPAVAGLMFLGGAAIAAAAILGEHGRVDISARREEYEAEGWTRFG